MPKVEQDFCDYCPQLAVFWFIDNGKKIYVCGNACYHRHYESRYEELMNALKSGSANTGAGNCLKLVKG